MGGIALCYCSILLHIALSSSSRTEYEAQWPNRLRTVTSSAIPVKCLTDIPKRGCLGIAHYSFVTVVHISCANEPANCFFFSDTSFFCFPVSKIERNFSKSGGCTIPLERLLADGGHGSLTDSL